MDKKNNIWCERAKAAYLTSTSYIDNNYRSKWEDALRHFASKHHSGSKYNKPAYKYRSKIFRPKTRSSIRGAEAGASAAFFSNMDLISIEAANSDDLMQVASANVTKELIHHRLQNTIPWYLICMGAFQDAQKVGVVASYQSWVYEEKEITYDVPGIDDEGNETKTTATETIVIKDEPQIRLIPVENIRIHPNADWTNPIKTSPYLIILWPMYVQDVRRRMKQTDPKTGEPKWELLTDEEIMSAVKQKYDSTRQVREGQREDKTDPQKYSELNDYDIVWVHENFLSTDEGDVTFFTLGTEYMLNQKPIPIEEKYFHGERPVVMGIGMIESHKIYPGGKAELGENLQKEINENASQRMDNVKLVLNKKHIVRRGSQINTKLLTRNVAGSVIMANDINADYRTDDFTDVTGSSYMEQDRLNADFDELVGNFSTGSITTNRRMNETVGGMSMLRAGAGEVAEYDIKTFAETWMEPVIKQLIKLEQKYETDITVLALAAQKAQLFQKYGINELTDELLNQNLLISVNAGIGATDPMLRVERFSIAVDRFSSVAERQAKLPTPILNLQEVGKELFGRLGYKDGARFTFQDNQQNQEMMAIVQQLQAAVQQLQQQLADKEADREVKLLETKMKEEGDDRRTAAQIEADILLKDMELANRVAA